MAGWEYYDAHGVHRTQLICDVCGRWAKLNPEVGKRLPRGWAFDEESGDGGLVVCPADHAQIAGGFPVDRRRIASTNIVYEGLTKLEHAELIVAFFRGSEVAEPPCSCCRWHFFLREADALELGRDPRFAALVLQFRGKDPTAELWMSSCDYHPNQIGGFLGMAFFNHVPEDAHVCTMIGVRMDGALPFKV